MGNASKKLEVSIYDEENDPQQMDFLVDFQYSKTRLVLDVVVRGKTKTVLLSDDQVRDLILFFRDVEHQRMIGK